MTRQTPKSPGTFASPDNIGSTPTREQPQSDTEPEPFGSPRKIAEADTAPRCYACGSGPFDEAAVYAQGFDDAAKALLDTVREYRLSDCHDLIILETALRHRLGQV